MKEEARGMPASSALGESSGGLAQDASALSVLVVCSGARVAALCESLTTAGLHARAAASLVTAQHIAAEWRPRLALVDADLPGVRELVAGIKSAHPCACVLLAPSATGRFLSLGSSVRADFVAFHPVSAATLQRIAAQRLAPPEEQPSAALSSELPETIVGSSAGMRPVWQLVMAGALSSSSVLITGATGTGKELIARALHRFSERRGAPFVAVNCAALAENLLESELFGHEKGAFTGAVAQHKGRFELADGGTLFLDEIGDLPMGLQVKLLRVLQERTFERVGGNKSIAVDLRVVAATHRNLPEDVQRGRFRADLFYRLNVLSIGVPPLRHRAADIVEFWNCFIAQGATRDGRAIPRSTPEVLRVLMRHSWPGNVRELYNAAEHVLTVVSGEEVLPSDLPESLRETHTEPGLGDAHELAGLTLREIERIVIRQSYEALGTVKATAAVLGISARKVHYRLRESESGIERRPPRKKSGARPIGGRPTLARVLVAEDDDELRATLCDVLKIAGFDAVGAPDGHAVLEHLGSAMLLEQRDAPPDIIVADVRMPGMTGMELLECVRNRGWSTPFVLMSAFGQSDLRRQASDLGATAFLDKPIDTSKLQQLLHDAVNG